MLLAKPPDHTLVPATHAAAEHLQGTIEKNERQSNDDTTIYKKPVEHDIGKN